MTTADVVTAEVVTTGAGLRAEYRALYEEVSSKAEWLRLNLKPSTVAEWELGNDFADLRTSFGRELKHLDGKGAGDKLALDDLELRSYYLDKLERVRMAAARMSIFETTTT